MNILPKKRWHVRTKDNIARVRRDEAQAAEEEREKLRRAKLAEQEARTALLRQRARAGRADSDGEQTEDIVKATPAGHDGQGSSDEGQPPKKAPPKKKVDAFSRVQQTSATTADIYTKEGNINFFKELESGGPGTTGSLTNKEHEAEEKAEKEKYEKQIGLLTYLGQDSLEASKTTEWYNDEDKYVSAMWSKAAKNKNAEDEEEDGKTAENLEIGLKYKKLQDPLTDVIKYTGWKPTKSCPASGSNVLFSPTSNNRMIEHGAVSSTNTSMLAISDGKCDRKLKKMLKKKKKLDRKIKERSSNLKCSSKKSKKHKREKRNDDRRDKSQLRRKNKSKSTESSSRMSSRKDLQGRGSNHETSSKRKRKRSSSSSDSDDRPSRKKRRSKSSKRSRSSSDSSHASSNSSYTTDSEAERQDKEERHKQLEKLRAERLAREAEERKRAQRLLAGLDPNVEPPPAPVPGAARQKYSAQFNPLVARQNKEPLRAGVKYF